MINLYSHSKFGICVFSMTRFHSEIFNAERMDLHPLCSGSAQNRDVGLSSGGPTDGLWIAALIDPMKKMKRRQKW